MAPRNSVLIDAPDRQREYVEDPRTIPDARRGTLETVLVHSRRVVPYRSVLDGFISLKCF